MQKAQCNMRTFIFTEAFNCGKITRVALQSFLRYHSGQIHVFGTDKDFSDLGDIIQDKRVELIDCTNDMALKHFYYQGHTGTAYIFAKVLSGQIGGDYGNIIHFDGDVVFKKEIISDATGWLNDFHIFGSRRCYVNNPAGIKVDPDLPDTVSTYFFGIRRSIIPRYDFEYLTRMCAGAVNPLGHSVFDFFDPVTFVAIKNGARIKFVDSDIIGGQNDMGSKVNKYPSNLHLDMGSHLAHFGGVGSGYSYLEKTSKPPAAYANWAVGRYSLFVKLFYNQDIGYYEPAVYGPDSRWVNGGYDEEILNQVRKDLLS